MPSKYPSIDLKKITTIPFSERKNKVKFSDFGTTYEVDKPFPEFIDSLPKVLAAQSIRTVAKDIFSAYSKNKPVVAMIGAHVIKCGLSTILIDLMHQGIITAIAMNGAGAIHDFEIAMWGATSEDVHENIRDGKFGMVQETTELMNKIITAAATEKCGMGESLGKTLIDTLAPYIEYSILATGFKLSIPVTVFVAIGTDVIHQHPVANGAALGETSLHDFRIFCSVISELDDGGVVLNLGSAVILPEVFIKAVNIARNVGKKLTNFTTANFDMIQHYRPNVNVVTRPVAGTGHGYSITGHHEILIPLLAAMIKTELYNYRKEQFKND